MQNHTVRSGQRDQTVLRSLCLPIIVSALPRTIAAIPGGGLGPAGRNDRLPLDTSQFPSDGSGETTGASGWI
jgi:hypothetical protein